MLRRLLRRVGWLIVAGWVAILCAVAGGRARPYAPMFAYTQRGTTLSAIRVHLHLYDPQSRVHYRVPGALNASGNTNWTSNGDGVAVALSFTTDPALYRLGAGWEQLDTPLPLAPRNPPYLSEQYYIQLEPVALGWDVLAVEDATGDVTYIDDLRGVPGPPQVLWLPDGRRVLSFIQVGDTLQISIHDVDTGRRTFHHRLPNTEVAPYTLRYATEQPWLAFRTRPAAANTRERLYMLDTANERLQRVMSLSWENNVVGFRPGAGWD